MLFNFQHYCHHAKSLMNKPYHCGFFFKIWDNMFNCVYPPEKCFCAECSRSKGERTLKAFEKVIVPNYIELFHPKTWLSVLPIKSVAGIWINRTHDYKSDKDIYFFFIVTHNASHHCRRNVWTSTMTWQKLYDCFCK